MPSRISPTGDARYHDDAIDEWAEREEEDAMDEIEEDARSGAAWGVLAIVAWVIVAALLGG